GIRLKGGVPRQPTGKAWHREEAGPGREYARRHLQKKHGAQQRDAPYRGGSRDLRGARGWRAPDLRARGGAADGTEVFFVLESSHVANRRQHPSKQPLRERLLYLDA